jgi:hypothetical protein
MTPPRWTNAFAPSREARPRQCFIPAEEAFHDVAALVVVAVVGDRAATGLAAASAVPGLVERLGITVLIPRARRARCPRLEYASSPCSAVGVVREPGSAARDA